jgi:hypothetical protein
MSAYGHSNKKTTVKNLGKGVLLASCLLAGTSSWADPEYRPAPLGVYVGGAMGFGINARSCDNYDSANTGSCSRASFSQKVFAGYRLTPGLAAEVNYFYFGSVRKTIGPSSSNVSSLPAGTIYDADVKDSAHAATLNINWEVDLNNFVTNHLRFGVAWVHHDTAGHVTTVSSSSPFATTTQDVTNRQLEIKPYVGAALSFRVNEYVRVFTGYDFLIDGHQSLHMLAAGISGEY